MIYFLQFVFHTLVADLLASIIGLETAIHAVKAKTNETEAEAQTQEAEARFLVSRPRPCLEAQRH